MNARRVDCMCVHTKICLLGQGLLNVKGEMMDKLRIKSLELELAAMELQVYAYRHVSHVMSETYPDIIDRLKEAVRKARL